MPIFISYNHADKEFVRTLATNLVRERHNVWIDMWELNAGDSLIERIQNAVGGADAILAILSKKSIESNWCKKELNAGLVRELEENRILLIPCVIDDCEIPMFLKEKLYVDFRADADEAFSFLDRSLRRISNPQQSRIESHEFFTDWSVDWGEFGDESVVEWIFVDHGQNVQYVVLTRCRLILRNGARKVYRKRLKSQDHIEYASSFLTNFIDEVKGGSFRVLITSAAEISETVRVFDKDGKVALLHISIRRLGIDNGMDTLFTVDEIIRKAIAHSTNVMRGEMDQ